MIVRGQIKVDANMAAAKIRDHLLSDLELYATEIARAAVAFGATWLTVTWDLDDVVLTCDGQFPPVAELARARDYVLGGASREHAAGLRLLGIGVSAALGLDPAFVDVSVTSPAATRIRFARDAVQVQPAASAEVPDGCLRVLVRRKLGLHVLRARTDAPRAVRHLVERAWSSSLRLTVQGDTYVPPIAPLVVATPRASSARVRLELLPAATPRGCTVFVERSFALASYEFVGGPADVDTAGLPIRVVIEADRLPTNASRSAIRLETPALESVFRALGSMFDPLLREALARRDEPAVAEAAGALAAWVFRRRLAGYVLEGPFDALLDLPSMQDAFGRALALRPLLRAAADASRPLLVHEGDQPLEPALAPLFPDTVWRRGHAVERALASVNTVRADEAVLHARVGWRKRERALARAPLEPTVPPATGQLHRERFDVTEGSFRGLRGEIVICDGSNQSPACRVHWFLDGQRFECTYEQRPTFFPLELALAWDGRLETDLAYEQLQRTSRRDAAVAYAHCVAAIVALERRPDPALGHAAIRTWLRGAAELGVDPTPATLPEALQHAPVWAVSDGRFVSLRVLAAEVGRLGVLCTSAEPTPPAPDGRPVVLESECELLRRLLPATHFVAYGSVLRAGAFALPARDPRLSVAFERPDVAGYLSPGAGRMHVYHAGACWLTKTYRSRFGPVDIVVDARSAVPRPGGEGFVGRLAVGQFRTLERDLLDLLLQAIEGGAFDRDVPDALHAYVTEAERAEDTRLLDARLSGRGEPRTLRTRVARLGVARERLAQVQTGAARADFFACAAAAPPLLGPPEAWFRTEHAGIGSLTVALPAPGLPPPNGIVTFQGRLLAAQRPTGLPIAVVSDVIREDYVAGSWTALTPEGAAWVRQATVSAALALLRRCVAQPHVLDDEAALQLAAALCRESRDDVASCFVTTAWPTVDGQRQLLPRAPTVRVGERAYVPYLRGEGASSLDALVLLAPVQPVGKRLLLAALGYALEDVSELVARVQTARAECRGDAIRYRDTMGRLHVLADLIAAGDLHFTTSARHDGVALEIDDRAVLLLEPAAIPGLRRWLQDLESDRKLRDVTEQLDREQRGAQRRQARELERIELTAEMRAYCSKVVRFVWNADGLRGELGLLRPEHAQHRGLWLFSAKRPLARLDDLPDTWPTVAVIDVGGLRTNSAFDGLARFDDEERIRRAIANTVRLEARALQEPDAVPHASAPGAAAAPVTASAALETTTVIVEEAVLESSDRASFWAHLWRAALERALPPPVPAAPAALVPLAACIEGFGLYGAPVASVAATHTGRPVRYELASRRVVVNVRHAAVVRLLAAGHVVHLALAAASEINRELAVVTEADEREVVRALLAGLRG